MWVCHTMMAICDELIWAINNDSSLWIARVQISKLALGFVRKSNNVFGSHNSRKLIDQMRYELECVGFADPKSGTQHVKIVAKLQPCEKKKQSIFHSRELHYRSATMLKTLRYELRFEFWHKLWEFRHWKPREEETELRSHTHTIPTDYPRLNTVIQIASCIQFKNQLGLSFISLVHLFIVLLQLFRWECGPRFFRSHTTWVRGKQFALSFALLFVLNVISICGLLLCHDVFVGCVVCVFVCLNCNLTCLGIRLECLIIPLECLNFEGIFVVVCKHVSVHAISCQFANCVSEKKTFAN